LCTRTARSENTQGKPRTNLAFVCFVSFVVPSSRFGSVRRRRAVEANAESLARYQHIRDSRLASFVAIHHDAPVVVTVLLA